MKKRIGITAFILSSILLLSAFSGCSGPKTDPEDLPDRNPDVPSGKFNEGIVEYVKKTESYYRDAFDETLLGKIVDGTETGVTVLADSDFSDGDKTLDSNVIVKNEGDTEVIDGKLYIPYSGDPAAPFGSGWTTWAPNIACLGDEFLQAQLSFDCEFNSDGSGAWESAMVGVFKNDPGSIADHPGDGIFIAFNPLTSSIAVYGGDGGNWAWPTGNVSVKVPKDLIKGETHVDVVACENKDITVYLKGQPVLKIGIDGGKMTVTDSAGKVKYTGDIDPDSVSGDFFSFFTHLGGVALDNISLYGCSKGSRITNTIIEAKPVGDNKLGLDITDRYDLVSICYTMWFNAIHGNGTDKIETAHNVAEYTEKYGFSTEYGFGTKDDRHNAMTAFHYWSKPAQGYYRSTDTNAIRNNMTMLYNAGVDFIILDYTYATAPGYNPGTSPWASYIEGPLTALLDTIMEMRAEGLGTPYVVCWMGSDNMFGSVKTRFLDVEKWKDCFVYWNGKPFIMDWNKNEAGTYEDLTVRSMYGLRGQASEGQWSYLEIDNGRTVSFDASGRPEHMCADVATQETYMSLPTAHGRQGGRFWNGQWKNVFEVRPKIVTVTWWNEWCAQLYYVDGVGFIFTDNFNQEYSRDVEPMEGGHGDLYYRWLCEYIRCYKKGLACPDLTE